MGSLVFYVCFSKAGWGGGTLIRRYFSRQWKRERGMCKRKSIPGKGREGVCVLGLPEEDPTLIRGGNYSLDLV